MLVSGANPSVYGGSLLHFTSLFLETKYKSMARRTNSATGAPVLADNFWSFVSCSVLRNRAVRFMSAYDTTQAYICTVVIADWSTPLLVAPEVPEHTPNLTQ
jgi:hypothetical protein